MDNQKKYPTAVIVAGYNIEQDVVKETKNNFTSYINVKFIVHDSDTGPDKHALFLNDLSEFLKERNTTIPQETLDWMKDVGVTELGRSFSYHLPSTGMIYSNEYLKNTPLEQIKAGYERNLKVNVEPKKVASALNELVTIRTSNQVD